MSASKEELEYALRCSVETFTELLLKGILTKAELLEKIDEILTELGYSN